MGTAGTIVTGLVPFAIAIGLGLFLRISETAVVVIASGAITLTLFEFIKKFGSKPIAKTLYRLQLGIAIFGGTILITTLLKLWFLKP